MTGEVDMSGNRGRRCRPRREIWPRVASLAAAQHGVVGRAQLVALGLGAEQIRYMAGCEILHRLHSGIHAVYAVGHRRLTRHGSWMAAVLAGGPGAVLSHLSAAMLWMLIPIGGGLPEITTPAKGRRRDGLRRHASAIPTDEIAVRDGIPVTTVARTMVDLAACVGRDRLERALAEAEYRRYADSPSLPELIERHRGRRGIGALREIVAAGDPWTGVTRSPLEDRFARFLARRGLERPELNAPIVLAGGTRIVVDCLWRRQRIALELDGRASHLRTRTWEADRLRDRRLAAGGWTPIRVTAEQLREDPAGLERDLRSIGVGDRARAAPPRSTVARARAAEVDMSGNRDRRGRPRARAGGRALGWPGRGV